MAYSRIMETIDAPLLYEYLTMSVEDAEYPTAVPLFFGMLLAVPIIYGMDKLGFFAEAPRDLRKIPFFDVDWTP